MPEPGKCKYNDLADLFKHLDKAQGGDGMGLAWFNGKQIQETKGLNIDAELLAQLARGSDGPALFHTRRATCGPICDHLCQPFVIENTAVVHNGMWRDWADYAGGLALRGQLDAHRPINDSLIAAVLAATYGRYMLETIHSGVFVVMMPKATYLHLRGGSFEWCDDMGIYASDFPKGWSSESIKNDSIATLHADRPEFEEGGFSKYTVHYSGGWPPVKVWDPQVETYVDMPYSNHDGRRWDPNKSRWEKKPTTSDDTGEPSSDNKKEESQQPDGVEYLSLENLRILKYTSMSLQELEDIMSDPETPQSEYERIYQAWEDKLDNMFQEKQANDIQDELLERGLEAEIEEGSLGPDLTDEQLEALYEEYGYDIVRKYIAV